jgi:hypothetical protein
MREIHRLTYEFIITGVGDALSHNIFTNVEKL